MSKEPEGGGVGTAQRNAYTDGLHLPIMVLTVALVWLDLAGPRRLSAGTGFESGVWICLYLMATLTAALFVGNLATNPLYHHYTGLWYHQDRIGFGKSGGSDILPWSGYFGTVIAATAFAVLPVEWLGWSRPLALFATAVAVSGVLAGVFSTVVFGALYGPRQRIATFGVGHICQQVVLPRRRCHRTTFRVSEYCRWHRVLQEFRADLVGKPQVAPALMAQAGVWIALAVVAVRVSAGGPLWAGLLAAAVCLGKALKLFGDAVLARDRHPLSQFAVWPQLLAAGMTLEVAAGIGLAVHISQDPASARALFSRLAEAEWVHKYGPPALSLFGSVSAGFALTMLVRRVLFYHFRYFDALAWPVLLSLTVPAVVFAARGAAHAEEPAAVTGFWEPVTGGYRWAPIGAYWAAFLVAEVVNAGIRQRRLTRAGFQESVWPSLPICFIVPVFAVVVARCLVVWTLGVGLVPFAAVALLLCGVLTALLTVWLLRQHPGWHEEEEELGPVSVSFGVQQLLSQTDVQCALAVHRDLMARTSSRDSIHASVRGVVFRIVTRTAPLATEIHLLSEVQVVP